MNRKSRNGSAIPEEGVRHRSNTVSPIRSLRIIPFGVARSSCCGGEHPCGLTLECHTVDLMPGPTEVESVPSTIGHELAAERVLVVGAAPSVSGPVILPWEEFADRKVNIADYSLVVAAADTFELTGQLQANARGVFRDRGGRFLAGPNTELVVIGSSMISGTILSDLGRGFAYEAESGSFVTFRAAELEPYLRHVTSYSFMLHPVANQGVDYIPVMLAADRDILGVALRTPSLSRTLVLPSPSAVGLDEGVTSLLVGVYGLEGTAMEAPEWLKAINLPSDVELRNEQSNVTEALAPLLARQNEIRSELAASHKLLGVLYESGTTLEDLVHELLDALGADVAPPPNSETDDGTLTTPSGTQVVLEIKGRSGPIAVDDARQLTDWVNLRTYPDEESDPEEWKGLLIGNPFRHLPPDERTEDAFTPNCVRVSERDGHALITTGQLVDALRQLQEGRFDSDGWWQRIIDSNGVVTT